MSFADIQQTPDGWLIFDAAGNLYGTTFSGGSGMRRGLQTEAQVGRKLGVHRAPRLPGHARSCIRMTAWSSTKSAISTVRLRTAAAAKTVGVVFEITP